MPEFILDFGTPAAASAFAALDYFTQGYIEAAFFTESGTGDDGDMEDVTVADLAPPTLARMVADCAAFQSSPAYVAWLAWTESEGLEGFAATSRKARDHDALDMAKQAGRDFWYTRNRHGCGFWEGEDDGYPSPHDVDLTARAHAYGEVDIYRGDDGRIYQSGAEA